MSIEQKRHEGFEAYIKSTPQSNLISLERSQVDDGYADAEVHWSWLAWNAALDSVVIGLPHYLDHKYEDNYGRVDNARLRRDQIAAIESAGLKVRS